MIALIITLVVVSAVWLACEVYRAPVACESPEGLVVLEPGRQLHVPLPPSFRRIDPLWLWGVA
jgi:hypothetical protein